MIRKCDVETLGSVTHARIAADNRISARFRAAGYVIQTIDAAPNAVAPLQHNDGEPLLFQIERRIEARQPCSDNDNIGLCFAARSARYGKAQRHRDRRFEQAPPGDRALGHWAPHTWLRCMLR